MSKFLITSRFKWIQIDMNKYVRNSSKGCLLEVDLEHPKK